MNLTSSLIEKKPGEDRVPQVPDHIQGSKVRLLVAESMVTEYKPRSSRGSFVANLDKKDLARLRKITRRYSPVVLTNQECDEMIEKIGPRAALETLRYNVGKTIH